MADRVTTAVLKEKVDNIEKVFNRIDDAIGKIVEVNNNVSKMLAVHDERLVKQEKIDEVLFKKIDELHVKMDEDHKAVLETGGPMASPVFHLLIARSRERSPHDRSNRHDGPRRERLS